GGIVIPPGVCGRIWVKHSPVISNNQGRAICSDLHSEPLNARPIYICSGLVTGVCSIRSSQTDCLASPEKSIIGNHLVTDLVCARGEKRPETRCQAGGAKRWTVQECQR